LAVELLGRPLRGTKPLLDEVVAVDGVVDGVVDEEKNMEMRLQSPQSHQRRAPLRLCHRRGVRHPSE